MPDLCPPYYIIKIFTHNPFRAISTDVRGSTHSTFEEAKDHINDVEKETYRYAILRYHNGKWTKDASWEDGETLWMDPEYRDGRPHIISGSRPEHPSLRALKENWAEAVQHVWEAKSHLGDKVGTVEVAATYLDENFPELTAGSESLGRAAVYYGRQKVHGPDWLEGFAAKEKAVEVNTPEF